MKKIAFILFFALLLTACGILSFRKQLAPEEKYSEWKFSLQHATIDSVTVRYRIAAEARNMIDKAKVPEDTYYGILGLQLAEADTSEINSYKKMIIHKFPASKACFDFANAEFYDLIYPVWNDDHEKIIIIEKLLDKYHSTSWRRTMYQYLCYSLANIGDSKMLIEYLAEWRDSFPNDYLPWFVSAANYHLMNEDLYAVLELAQKAYELSLYPHKPQYYPEMEWELEERSARVRTAYTLAKVLMELNELAEAENIVSSSLADNKLGIDDETTTCRLHYALAEIYNRQNQKDKAVEQCCLALMEGDSRNSYAPLADSLLQQLSRNSNTLEYSRNFLNYDDVKFSDVTSQMGLDGVKGSRVAWGDFDGDGWEDFLLSGSRIFRNLNGQRFVDITADVFPQGVSFGGAVWGDVDNDGDLDIITKDPENIWINKNNSFVAFQGSTDFIDNEIASEGLAVADINQDNFLDIYLANYEGPNNTCYPDQLFIGKGNGSFKDVTYEAGAVAPHDASLAGRGVNMADYNNDGLMDIYVSNYRLKPNLLFVNQGKGVFIEKADMLGVAGEETDGWWGHTIGSEWGDIDNDGDFDLITCNLAHPRYIDFSNKTRLYINNGKPEYRFSDIRREAGIRYEETNSEPSWADFDNDGFLDLYITNVYEGRRSFLYMNNGDNTFRDVTWLSGTRHFNGWGNAACDFDNDGDLDLLVCGGDIQLFRNSTHNINNWLQIAVEPASGHNAIGTRIKIEGRDLVMIREIQGGKGSTNQHSFIQHFGLGNRKSGLSLTVVFPSGVIHKTAVKDVNNRYLIKENL